MAVENLAVADAGPAESKEIVTVWGAVAGIIDQPRRTLAAIYARPRAFWLVPLLLALLAGSALAFVSAPYGAEEARQQIRQQLEAMPADQSAAVAGQIERLTSPLSIGALGAATAGLGVFLGVLITAALLYFLALVAGADIAFRPWFTVVAWSWIPLALRDAVEAGFIALRGAPIANRGLSWLVSVGNAQKDATSFTYFVLSFVQIFVLWHLLLLWKGLRGGVGLSAGKTTFLVLVYAAIAVGLRWIPVLLAQTFSAGL